MSCRCRFIYFRRARLGVLIVLVLMNSIVYVHQKEWWSQQVPTSTNCCGRYILERCRREVFVMASNSGRARGIDK